MATSMPAKPTAAPQNLQKRVPTMMETKRERTGEFASLLVLE